MTKLRNRRFFSLAEANAAIRQLLDELNGRVTRHLGASRRQLFEQLDRPALQDLPAEPYTYAAWKECRPGLDYHVEIDKHYYSVPHTLLRQKLAESASPARNGSDITPPASVPMPKPWSTSSCARAPIPNRGSALPSAFCA